MYDSSDHEDANVNIEYSYCGCHDLFTHSFHHDSNSPTIYLYMPPLFDDPPADEVETPQAGKALQPELMVMSSSRSLEVSSTSDKKYVESPQAPHYFLVHIENKSSLQFPHPPPESHDPISHALEESYVVSTIAKQKFSSFFMFSHLSRLK